MTNAQPQPPAPLETWPNPWQVPSSGEWIRWSRVGHRLIQRWTQEYESDPATARPVAPVVMVDDYPVENTADPQYKADLKRWADRAAYALNEQTIAYAVEPGQIIDGAFAPYTAEELAARVAPERARNARLPRPATLSDDDRVLFLDSFVLLHEDDWAMLLRVIRARSFVTGAALEDAGKSDLGHVPQAGHLEMPNGNGPDGA